MKVKILLKSRAEFIYFILVLSQILRHLIDPVFNFYPFCAFQLLGVSTWLAVNQRLRCKSQPYPPLLSARPYRYYRVELSKRFIACYCPAEGICCRIILRSGMLHQVEETVNSNLNFDMLIRTTFMISLENFKDVFIHFIRTS